MADTEREAFEAWAKAQWSQVHRNEYGEYVAPGVQSNWLAWCAALASRPAEVDDWISVDERLPTEYEPVLTFGAKRVGQAVMQFSVKDDWQIETASEWHCSYPPKYWKPLGPEPSHTTNKEK